MPKGRPKVNLMLEEAELKKVEDLNRRKKKALEDQAELLRQERALASETDDEPDEQERVTGPISEQFSDILQGLEEGGKFWVFRIDEKGRSSQCGAWPVADWPARMEEIAHEAGGGTFKIQFKTESGQFVKQTTATFDPKFYGKKVESDGGSSGLVALMLSQAQEARREAAEARKENSDLMKTILTALMAPKDGGFIKSAQDIAVIGQMFDKKGDPMEMFRLGMDMAMKMSEGKEPPSTMDRLLETIAAPAATLMTRMASQPPRVAQPKTAALPGAVPKPLEEAPAAQPPDPVKEHPFYKQYVPKILAAAKAGEDVKDWAEHIADIIPAIYHPQLVSMMEKSDLVEFLGSYEFEARNYAVWIVGVRDELLLMFPPDEVTPVPIAGAQGLTKAHVDVNGNLKAEIPEVTLAAMNE